MSATMRASIAEQVGPTLERQVRTAAALAAAGAATRPLAEVFSRFAAAATAAGAALQRLAALVATPPTQDDYTLAGPRR